VTVDIPTERPSEWNPLEPEDFDSAHPAYTRLRAECPVPWSNTFGGFWAVTKYDDLVSVTEAESTFITSIQNTVPGIPRAERRPPLHIDPPDHAAFRRPLDQVFRKSVIGRREASFRDHATALLEPLVATGRADFSQDFALPYAIRCFADLLDLPEELVSKVREIGIRYSFAIQDMDKPRIKQTSDELYAVARDVVAARETTPADPDVDLVSSLLAASRDDDRVSHESVVSTVRQFLAAGVGAPHAVLGSCAVHLARDPRLQETLRREPDRLPAAVEEFLRLYSPYRVFARTATEDVTIRGREIRAGEAVALIFPSANRDEEVFTDPHTFKLDRRPNRHIAFGRGPHRCVAAAMARLELRVALAELLARTTSFALDGEVTMFNWLEFGPASSPMRCTGV
jgi:cytochrome P450